MDARELTKKVHELENIIYDYRKRIEYLEDCNRKLQMNVSDLIIDAEMSRRMKNEVRLSAPADKYNAKAFTAGIQTL